MIIRKKRKPKEQPSPQKEVAPKEPVPAPEQEKPVVQEVQMPSVDILDNIDVNAIVDQRAERRRGDRRRGYRRVDDRNLISRAEEEAQMIKEDAMKDGFAQGLKSSREKLMDLNGAMEQLLQAKEDSFDSVKDDIVDIAMKIAEKLIKKEVSVDNTVVLSIIADVLKELGKAEKQVTVRVNPDEEAHVRMNIPNMFPSSKTEATILIEADGTVELGSCVVETKNGIIDARFSTQLAILQSAFKEQF